MSQRPADDHPRPDSARAAPLTSRTGSRKAAKGSKRRGGSRARQRSSRLAGSRDFDADSVSFSSLRASAAGKTIFAFLGGPSLAAMLATSRGWRGYVLRHCRHFHIESPPLASSSLLASAARSALAFEQLDHIALPVGYMPLGDTALLGPCEATAHTNGDRVPPLIPAKADAGSTWGCPSCAFDNAADFPECVACGAPQPRLASAKWRELGAEALPLDDEDGPDDVMATESALWAALVARFPQLRSIGICGSITVDASYVDAVVAPLARSLRCLRLEDNPRLSTLSLEAPRLETLSVAGCSRLQSLSLTCPSLQDLSVAKTALDSRHAAALLGQVPTLRVLSLSGCDGVQSLVEEEDEADLCSICCTNVADTVFEPCGHTSCRTCAAMQMEGDATCFFCKQAMVSLRHRVAALEVLDVSGTSLSGPALAQLLGAQASCLRELRAERCPLLASAELEAGEALELLSLAGCEGLQSLALTAPRLRTLDVSRCHELQPPSLQCPLLGAFLARGMDVLEMTVSSVGSACGGLRSLCVGPAPSVGNPVLDGLPAAASLETLELTNTALSAEGLAATVAACPALRECDISGSTLPVALQLACGASLALLRARSCPALRTVTVHAPALREVDLRDCVRLNTLELHTPALRRARLPRTAPGSALSTAALSHLAPRDAARATVTARCSLHSVPLLPRHHVPDADLARLLEAALLEGDHSTVLLHGPPGTGKSLAAACAARTYTVRGCFRGVQWLPWCSSGVHLQMTLAAMLQHPMPFSSLAEGRMRLRRLLQRMPPVLVVVDGAPSVAEALTAFGITRRVPHSRVVVTTRETPSAVLQAEQLQEFRATSIHVPPLGEAQAVGLLSAAARRPVPGSETPEFEAMKRLCRKCRYIAQAVATMGGLAALLDASPPWDELLERLRGSKQEHVMPVLRTLLRCTDAAIRVAPRWVMDAAAELSAFPQRYPVPESTLVRLWEARHGLGFDAEATLGTLSGVGLVQRFEDRSAVLMPLARALMGVGGDVALHQTLVATYEQAVGAQSGTIVPPEGAQGVDLLQRAQADGYVHHHAVFHLCMAQRLDDALALTLCFRWLREKLHSAGVGPLLFDIALLRRMLRHRAATRGGGEHGSRGIDPQRVFAAANGTSPLPPLRRAADRLMDRALTGVRDTVRDGAAVLARDPDALGAQLLARLWERRSEPLLDALLAPLAAPGAGVERGAEGGSGEAKAWLRPTAGFVVHPPPQRRAVLCMHEAPVRCCALSASGMHALSGATDGSLVLWGVLGQLALRPLVGHSRMVNSVALSADAGLALTADEEGVVGVWQPLEGMLGDGGSAEPGSPARTFPSSAFDSSGALLPLAAWEGIAFEHTLCSPHATLRLGRHGGARSAAISRAKTSALGKEGAEGAARAVGVVLSADGTMHVLDVGDGVVLRTLPPLHPPETGVDLATGALTALAGRSFLRIVSGHPGGGVDALYAVPGKRRPAVVGWRGHTADVVGLALSHARMDPSEGGPSSPGLQDVHVSRSRPLSLAGGEVVLWQEEGVRTGAQGVDTSDARGIPLLRFRPREAPAGEPQPGGAGGEGEAGSGFSGSADTAAAFFGAAPTSLAAADDGTLFAVASRCGLVTATSIAGRAVECAFHHGDASCVSLSADARTMVGGGGYALSLWDLREGSGAASVPHHMGAVRGVATTEGGSVVVSAGNDHLVRVWEMRRPPGGGAAAKPELVHVMAGHTGPVTGISVSQPSRATFRRADALAQNDGSRGPEATPAPAPATGGATVAVSCSVDASVRVWSLSGGRCLVALAGHTGPAWCVDVAPDASTAASGGEGGAVLVWDLAARALHCSLKRGHTGRVNAVAFASSSAQVASAASDGRVVLWSIAATSPLRVLDCSPGVAATALAWSADGARFLVGDAEGRVVLWDAVAGTRVGALGRHVGAVRCLHASPALRRCATCSGDGVLAVWSVPLRKRVAHYVHDDRLLGCALAPAGATHSAETGPEQMVVAGDELGQLHSLELVGPTPWTREAAAPAPSRASGGGGLLSGAAAALIGRARQDAGGKGNGAGADAAGWRSPASQRAWAPRAEAGAEGQGGSGTRSPVHADEVEVILRDAERRGASVTDVHEMLSRAPASMGGAGAWGDAPTPSPSATDRQPSFTESAHGGAPGEGSIARGPGGGEGRRRRRQRPATVASGSTVLPRHNLGGAHELDANRRALERRRQVLLEDEEEEELDDAGAGGCCCVVQ